MSLRDRGLVTLTLHHADTLPLSQLMKALRGLVVHRAPEGVVGARYLAAVVRLLQSPKTYHRTPEREPPQPLRTMSN